MRRVLILFLVSLGSAVVGVCLPGCFGGRVPQREEHYLPTQVAEFYLVNLPSPPMESTLYRCLTASTKERISFPAFASSLKTLRPLRSEGVSSGRVTLVDKIDVSQSRSLIYALFRPQPAQDDFVLVRVDCRLEDGKWRIELPLYGGDVHPADVLLSGKSLDEKSLDAVGEVIGADRETVEGGIQRRKRGEEMRAAFKAREESVADLIILGKGCYNSGHYRKAMLAFSKALRLDPENSPAREYMEKCRQALKK